MNNIINKFLLTGIKFMPEMHLRQPGFRYSACGPFTKKKKEARIQKFKEIKDLRYIYQDELNKACFQHSMTFGAFKDLPRRTASDKVLHDQSFAIASNPQHDRYCGGLASIIHNFFQKKSSNTTAHTGRGIISDDQQLANELHKPITRKFKKDKIYSSY